MSSTNTLAPFQAFMEDGRPRCRCRVWNHGTGSQCKNPAMIDGICGTHGTDIVLGSFPVVGFYDMPRPRIWGQKLNGFSLRYLGRELSGVCLKLPPDRKAGDAIPWKSNATDPHGNTARPDSSDKTSDGATTRDGSNHTVFSRDGVNFHEDMGSGGVISIAGESARFRGEHARKLLERGIDVPDGCQVVTSWTNYSKKFEEALDRPENIKLEDKFKKYPNCHKKMYAFIHMSPGAPGEGALLDLIRESVDW